MPSAVNKVLEKMLDRLLASLTSGPSLNCRPHHSRQRIDFAAVAKLSDLSPEAALAELLGNDREVKLTARVAAPKRAATLGRRRGGRRTNGDGDTAEPATEGAEPPPKQEPLSPEERAWLDQQSLLTKFRIIADDARTYEQDTGVHVLNLGFPLLSLPPGTFSGATGGRSASRRVLAPIAFVPVAVTLGGGAAPTVRLACRGEGLDLVVPNVALLAWIEQQTGKAVPELFADDQGDDPWREIGELVRHVCASLDLPTPAAFAAPPSTPRTPPATPASQTQAPPPQAPEELRPRQVEQSEETTLHAADEEDAQRPPAGRHSSRSGHAISSDRENSLGGPVDSRPTAGVPTDPTLQVTPCPRSDDEDDDGTPKPTVLISAVLGLFPMANQGLLRDMQAMAGGAEPLVGPVQSFIDVGVSFEEAPDPAEASAPAQAVPQRPRVFADERLVAAADPCQSRAVRLARQSRGLVVHGPPGTGKSQTIANIIGDHLAREQRVLLVCDKRTALDVVADRLDHMGLRELCALIHDPQRDQRDLYMDVRQQLEALTETTTDEQAEGKLAKADAELQKLHAELTAHHKALMSRGAGGETGASFHELVGQWLALAPADVVGKGDGDANVERSTSNVERRTNASTSSFDAGSTLSLDAALLTQTNLAEVDLRVTELRDLLLRAESVGYPSNPWTRAAGISLAQLLGKPIETVRDGMANAARAANAADETADRAIPAFENGTDLVKVAAARAALADRLEKVATGIEGAVASRWASADPNARQRARQKLTEAEPLVKLFHAGPLDAELVTGVRDNPPAVTELNAQLATLAAYLEVARKWWGFLAFSKNSAAAGVLNKYGLTRSADSAERAQKFLSALRARLALGGLIREIGAHPAAMTSPLVADDVLDKQLTDHAAALDLLLGVGGDPLVAPLLPNVAKALLDGHARSSFLAGLRASPGRAAAIVQLEKATSATGLFAPTWTGELSSRLRTGSVEAEQYDDLADRLDTLEGVVRVRESLAAIPASLRAAADSLVAQSAAPDAGLAVLRREILAVEIRRRLSADPSLQTVDAHRLRTAFDRYRQLDGDKKKLVRDALLHRWTQKQRDRLLAAGGNRLSGLGADLKRRLTTRGQRAMRLRQVLAVGKGIEGGDPIFDLRPVWMASPETVAQVFPREAIFDVVVFDEASQCRLEEALPVLLRGKRVTIAGDPKQLPPTRFFESAVARSDDDEEITSDQQLFEQQQGETEDLLQAALGLDIQQCYLDVHYRSRNAELIEFSNEHFYDSRLQAIPGHPKNRAPVPPLSLYRANGTYEKRVNEAEADKVCEIVRDLLKRADPPSIGIACFNLAQRDLIVEALDELAEEDKAFGKRLAEARTRKGAGSFEGLFVKNLENVQGDERDHIIISTTYGPDLKGRFYRRFGPLGREGGGRRLNVLVTRARQEVHLVTSIPPEAYRSLPPVPQGQTPGGGYLLFSYLQYAEELEQHYAAARAAERGEAAADPATSRAAPEASDEHTVEMSSWEKGDSEEDAAKRRSDADAAEPAPAEPAVRERPTKTPSPVARALADKLADARGVGSDVHWGNDGFCVDLALHHPSRPGDVTVGVLCDAARFTASEDPVEWDVFRTGVLESQGWRLHRLWSPHFFRDPSGSVATILRDAQSELAGDASRDGIRVSRGRGS